ncbi:YeeE/YedE family protein [Sneathiella sp. P13V-1]|uniref:YeeE/YedE family protein n=1 Tax=Sneathiella sp. P13V-1 TaxID=2697366 RepID=UPI00187B97C7|nr:YeeE/YedE family protein [Sneathiella sp. P13V-1]MBE7637871.1 YeeE/YedE family protein [Sneathiella sp. P13V-1]
MALSVVALLLCVALVQLHDQKMALLFFIALLMGVTLYHSSFSFSAAYRKLFSTRETSGVQSHILLLGLTTLLFAPLLSGAVSGIGSVSGAVAPVGLSLVFGAFVFGIGMQLGGACASGSLYTAGSGNPRMILVLIFFCAGAFWGSLDLVWWQELPSLGVITFADTLGWGSAITLQLGILALIYLFLKLIDRATDDVERTVHIPIVQRILRGPWKLGVAALILALLNVATLVNAGHPWTITWGFTLWGAKVANLLGWNELSSSFWASGFQYQALQAPFWEDLTSVMNIGIMAGAFTAMLACTRKVKRQSISLRHIAAACLGGLMLGYGARLAYGCNIGAFVSGAASTSLHGWVWIACALPGNWLGMHLRKYFHLKN